MRPDPQLLVHLCTAGDWESARALGEVKPPSLADAGFVHLSSPEQAHLPANRIFGGRTDLVVLFLAADRLGAPVRWEPGLESDPAGMLFPHLYGPLPVGAVVEVRRYLPDLRGRFPRLSTGPGDPKSPSRDSC